MSIESIGILNFYSHYPPTLKVASHNALPLPEDLHTLIFSFLPVKERLQCRLVSKKFNEMINRPNLWKKEASILNIKEEESEKQSILVSINEAVKNIFNKIEILQTTFLSKISAYQEINNAFLLSCLKGRNDSSNLLTQLKVIENDVINTFKLYIPLKRLSIKSMRALEELISTQFGSVIEIQLKLLEIIGHEYLYDGNLEKSKEICLKYIDLSPQTFIPLLSKIILNYLNSEEETLALEIFNENKDKSVFTDGPKFIETSNFKEIYEAILNQRKKGSPWPQDEAFIRAYLAYDENIALLFDLIDSKLDENDYEAALKIAAVFKLNDINEPSLLEKIVRFKVRTGHVEEAAILAKKYPSCEVKAAFEQGSIKNRFSKWQQKK